MSSTVKLKRFAVLQPVLIMAYSFMVQLICYALSVAPPKGLLAFNWFRESGKRE